MEQADYETDKCTPCQNRRTDLDRCFFGQKSAFKVQYNESSNAIFIGIGSKSDDGNWEWKNAKLKDTEAADVIRVLDGHTDAVSFYHTFGDQNTKIWINRKEDRASIRIEDFAKVLVPGEQAVLKILLTEAICRSSFAGSARSASPQTAIDNNGVKSG